jgi:hypothetical protein
LRGILAGGFRVSEYLAAMHEIFIIQEHAELVAIWALNS